MESYTCILFDLDHTLWDYERNSLETLHELYLTHQLKEKGIREFSSFHHKFSEVNLQLWDMYEAGMIDSAVIRRDRFRLILKSFYAYDEKLCENLSKDYLHECPKKGHLMPGALETLQYLAGKYRMAVITNGFEEIQNMKITYGKLDGFFDHVITSQKALCRKPSKEIFDYALKANGVACHQALMVGDNLVTDMGGARNASVDNVFFNPGRLAHAASVKYEIAELAELRSFL